MRIFLPAFIYHQFFTKSHMYICIYNIYIYIYIQMNHNMYLCTIYIYIQMKHHMYPKLSSMAYLCWFLHPFLSSSQLARSMPCPSFWTSISCHGPGPVVSTCWVAPWEVGALALGPWGPETGGGQTLYSACIYIYNIYIYNIIYNI